MLFAFALRNIQCNAVLSSEDDWWGKEDGIRVFFLVFTANGFRQILISGREHPEPDMVENYSFRPGERLDLRHFPPINGPDWETDPIDVGETDTVSIAVIGINEGLPWVGGGGGFGLGGQATSAGFEELSKKMVEEAAKEAAAGAMTSGAAGVGMTVAFKLLEAWIEELNRAPDCRGVAFAFEVGLNLKQLFQGHLHTKRTTMTLNAENAANALHIVALSKDAPHCGKPDYEVALEIARYQSLDLAVDDPNPAPRAGAPQPFDDSFTLCKPEALMFIWPLYLDRTLTIQATIPKYATFHPTWKVDDIILPDHGSVPLTLTKEVEIPANEGYETRQVQIDAEVVTIGNSHQLRIRTRGEDGNYGLRVSLSYQFDDNGPWVLFAEKELYIQGQGMAGNQAYEDYMACLEHFRSTIAKYMAMHRRLEPGTPIMDLNRFRRHLDALAEELVVARELVVR